MTNSPGHDHEADPWRTSQHQVQHLDAHHECEDGENCVQMVAAETADLMCETMECDQCRDAIVPLIDHLISRDTPLSFIKSVVLSLVSSLGAADRKINEGIKTYEQMVKSN